MKNTKILATLVVLPILGIFSYVNADYDCSTVDREAIKTLLDKQAGGSTLTSDETATLENAKACRPTEGSGSTMKERKMRFGSGQTMPERTGSGMMMRDRDGRFGSGQTLSEEQKAQMEQIHTIMSKKQNGETLTTEEQALLDAHQAQMGNKMQERQNNNSQKKERNQNTNTGKLSSSYQKAIDNKVESLVGKYTTKDDKVTALNAFSTKISALKSNIDSLNLSDSKKATYNNIIDYLLQKINDTVSNLNDGTDTDTLLNQILN